MIRLFAGILTLIYLVTSSNVTINMHYCCDQLVDVAFYAKADCGHGSNESEDGFKRTSCCDNQSLVFASETHVSSSEKELEYQKVKIGVSDEVSSEVASAQTIQTYNTRAGPPDNVNRKIYLLNSSFLHYG